MACRPWGWWRALPSYAKPMLALFVVGNLFLIRTLWRDVAAEKGRGLAGAEGAFDWYVDDDASHWRLLRSTRQILDFRESRSAMEGGGGGGGGVDLVDPGEAQGFGGGKGEFLNCAALDDLRGVQWMASGWTKAVYRAKYGRVPVAFKRVNVHGHDMSACVAQNPDDFWRCYRKSAAKILKEIVLLRELAHPNVLKVFGYCIPNGESVSTVSNDPGGSDGVSLITELGEALDIIRLLQSSWEDRLRLSLGVTRLIYHLAHSPLGSLVMNDFRRQQFVLVDGELKVSDVDDLVLEEPRCVTDEQCTIRHEAADLVLSVQCVGGRCRGFNEKQNIYNAGRHFVTFLLPHGAPQALRPQVSDIVNAYTNVTWDTRQLLDALVNVQDLFIDGRYLHRGGEEAEKEAKWFKGRYTVFENSDLPGVYDYRCHLTLSGNGCTMSIYDELEAMEMCNEDRDCLAFVITPQKSWTGRKIVHFKSNYSSPIRNSHTTLYAKVT